MVAPDRPFEPAEYERRLAALRARAADRHLDAVVLHSPENIYYLSGFQTVGFGLSYSALLVPVDGDPQLIVRYGERSNAELRTDIHEVVTYRDGDDPLRLLIDALRPLRKKRLGIDVPPQSSGLPDPNAFIASRSLRILQPAAGLVEGVRALKSSAELAYVREAARVSSMAIAAVAAGLGRMSSDADVAACVWSSMLEAGGEYSPLPPMITVGERTKIFHATWAGTTIQEADTVVVEVPGVVGRYLAPLGRTFVRGPVHDHIRRHSDLAVESLEAAIGALRPGATCGEVFDVVAAPYLREGVEVPIKVGYSVGIAFPPRWSDVPGLNLNPGNDVVLEPGMVFHIPRSVRKPDAQTVLVSETILVTDQGNEVLTQADRAVIQCQ